MPLKRVHKAYILTLSLLVAAICVPKDACAACNFNPGGASSGIINFGAIDPSGSGRVYGTVATPITFTCSPAGFPFIVTASPASPWILTGPGSMNYTIGFITGGTSQGNGAQNRISLLTNASYIDQADYQDAPNGAYSSSQSITLTIDCPACGQPINATIPATTGVTASIASTCTSAVNGSMSFNIDPSGSGTLTPNTTNNGTSPSVKCTKNSTPAIACTSVHGNKLTIGNDGSTDPIAYTITSCPAIITGSGFTTATPIPIGISIVQAAYQDAQAGAHSDTITVTVTY